MTRKEIEVKEIFRNGYEPWIPPFGFAKYDFQIQLRGLRHRSDTLIVMRTREARLLWEMLNLRFGDKQ